MKDTVEGLGELTVTLHRLRGVASRKHKLAALMRGGAVVEREAKLLCPVASGTLRASIEAEEVGEEVHVGPHTDYAGHVEFGTVHMAAQPYMRPAYDGHIARIRGVIVYYLTRLVGRAAR